MYYELKVGYRKQGITRRICESWRGFGMDKSQIWRIIFYLCEETDSSQVMHPKPQIIMRKKKLLVIKPRYRSSFVVTDDTENNLGELRICKEYIFWI
jgi:hypothetical protein